jgi:hypothetical protein
MLGRFNLGRATFAVAPLLLLSAVAQAQTKGPSPNVAGDPGGFSAKGLNYERELSQRECWAPYLEPCSASIGRRLTWR